jgi:hypothetical protein
VRVRAGCNTPETFTPQRPAAAGASGSISGSSEEEQVDIWVSVRGSASPSSPDTVVVLKGVDHWHGCARSGLAENTVFALLMQQAAAAAP